MSRDYRSERPDKQRSWNDAEDLALREFVAADEKWSAQQIASLLRKRGFELRSRCAIIGRMSRLGLRLRGSPADGASRMLSKRKRNKVREKFLEAMQGMLPERHKNDKKPMRKPVVEKPTLPNLGVLRKHGEPDGKALGIGIEQLKAGQCHFPFGHKAPFKFCGRETEGRASYCAEHNQLTHGSGRSDYEGFKVE